MVDNLISKDEFAAFMEKKPRVRAFMMDVAQTPEDAYVVFNGMAEGTPYPWLEKDPSGPILIATGAGSLVIMLAMLGGGGLVTTIVGATIMGVLALATISLAGAFFMDATKASKPHRKELSFDVLEKAANKYDAIKNDESKRKKALDTVHTKGIALYAHRG